MRVYSHHSSFTHLVWVIQLQSNSLTAFLTLIDFTYIKMCIYTYVNFKLKRPTILYEDTKVVFNVMCSLVTKCCLLKNVVLQNKVLSLSIVLPVCYRGITVNFIARKREYH